MASSWNSRTNRVVGFIEKMPNDDMRELKSHLTSCSPLLGHPLMVPELILHMLTAKLNLHRLPCEEEFYLEERRTGLSNAPPYASENHAPIWSWNSQDFEDVTTRANQAFTTVLFLQRRFRFTKQLAQRLLSLLEEINGDPNLRIRYKDGRHQWKQRLSNRVSVLESYEHQTECVQKRIANLNTVVRNPHFSLQFAIDLDSSTPSSPKSTAETKATSPKSTSASHKQSAATASPCEQSHT